MQNKTALLSLALAGIAIPASAHAEIKYSATSGIDYSSGNYGLAIQTEVVSAPLALRVAGGPWALRASTSYLQITGPADVSDSDGGDGGAPLARTGTVHGLGDANLAVSYTFRKLGGSDAYIETTARVRIPTGDEEKGLGVGATDYGLSSAIGVSKRSGSASVEVTRRFLGDHADLVRQDGWQVSSTAWLRAGEKMELGLFGSWRDASFSGNEDPAQLGAFVSHQLTQSTRLVMNVMGGLSDASADYSTSLRLTWRFASAPSPSVP